jgi:hydrogenase expression/formation protein HypC
MLFWITFRSRKSSIKTGSCPTFRHELDRVPEQPNDRGRNLHAALIGPLEEAQTNMCLAVPARIVELEDDRAVVDAMGNRWKAKTTLLPEAKLGDIVLVHAGFAISQVDEEEAKKTWELFAEMESLANEADAERVSG